MSKQKTLFAHPCTSTAIQVFVTKQQLPEALCLVLVPCIHHHPRHISNIPCPENEYVQRRGGTRDTKDGESERERERGRPSHSEGRHFALLRQTAERMIRVRGKVYSMR